MNKSIYLLLLGSFVLVAFKSFYEPFIHVPDSWPKPTYDFTKNPLTAGKIALGRSLFYDPVLSRDSTVSCATCHLSYTAFTHVDHNVSHGIEDRIGFRNSLALVNLAWNRYFMWDGAINHLDMQSLAPMHDSTEMGETITHIIAKLERSKKYREKFYTAFGDSIPTGEHTLKSLSQFMLTIVSANAKYDQVMKGDTTFTAQEQNGYQLFKIHCASCHQEPLFTNGNFANNGLPIDTAFNDFGRMRVTKLSADSLKFKVPTLRNIEFSFPYMHDGRFKKLSQVMNHYTKGIQDSHTLDDSLKGGVALTSNEKVDIIAFLLTLSDKSFLFNKDLAFPQQ